MTNRNLSVTEAAKLLRTSPPTVRKLITNGDLNGTIARGGTRNSFLTTTADVDAFLKLRGHYPHRRDAPKSRVSRLEQRVRDLENAAKNETKVRELRAVVRAQNASNDHLSIALKMQTKAAEYLRLADAAHAEALSAALAAHEEQRNLTRLHGIPDNVSSAMDP